MQKFDHYHLPCKRRTIRLFFLLVVGLGFSTGGGVLWSIHGLSWWTGLLTGIGVLKTLLGLFHLFRGPVTLVLCVPDGETLYATILPTSQAEPSEELNHTELGYSVAVPVSEISHLWRSTRKVNLVTVSDSLHFLVNGQRQELADLLLNMSTVTGDDLERIVAFLQRYQPNVALSYPRR